METPLTNITTAWFVRVCAWHDVFVLKRRFYGGRCVFPSFIDDQLCKKGSQRFTLRNYIRKAIHIFTASSERITTEILSQAQTCIYL